MYSSESRELLYQPRGQGDWQRLTLLWTPSTDKKFRGVISTPNLDKGDKIKVPTSDFSIADISNPRAFRPCYYNGQLLSDREYNREDIHCYRLVPGIGCLLP